jgi:hypothetical protein
MRFAIGCVLALALFGCGGDDDGGNGGQNQLFACDIGAGGSSHACYEFSWNGPANAADQFRNVCNSSGAVTVTACPASGKVGGCRYNSTSQGVTVTWTNWFYFGTAADLMQACVSQGSITAMWVNP